MVKRNWQGCTKYFFLYQEGTIQHLFMSCPFAKILWRVIDMAFNIASPANLTNLFGHWCVAKKRSTLEWMCALCCGLFEIYKMISFLANQCFYLFYRLSL
jgi:hypothetical protein